MKTPKTYNEFHKIQLEQDALIRRFELLGVKISATWFKYNFESISYINEEVQKIENNPFTEQLTLSHKLALCLACVEEDRNNHVYDVEIDDLNKFFDTKITRDLISEMHSRFI